MFKDRRTETEKRVDEAKNDDMMDRIFDGIFDKIFFPVAWALEKMERRPLKRKVGREDEDFFYF